MTDTNQEPTMEEILASIRRIISEDDAPAADDAAATAPAAVEAAPEPEPEPEAPVALSDFAPDPEPVSEASDEVLDLTDRVESMPEAPAAPPVESLGDLDVYPQDRPAPEPAWNPPPAAPVSMDDGLVSSHAAGRAASAFDQLASSLVMPKDGRTLEDVVQELLRPLLKSWLDENLPTIVQRAVEAEVERIARGRVR